jgi:eukaryotic-like serine/threonine-protein kinase
MSSVATPKSMRLGLYDLIEKIAEGGMGTVYKAQHIQTGAVVAVKVLPLEMTKNAVLMRRFEQEFRSAAVLDHPNVVKGLDYSDRAPSPYLVMEYVPGKSLGQKIELGGPMAFKESIYVLSQVCEGLHSAHKQGLIHRDIKPDNILVMPNLVAKITDLGLVRDLDSEEQLTRTGRGLGTPYYMAPEQFRNAKNVDVRSDIYSLGATFYVMLTGKIPFEHCSPLDCWIKKSKDDFPAPRTFNDKIPLRADQAIRRAMSANPANRPKSCREFMEDILGEKWHPAALGGSSKVAPEQDLWYVVFYDQGFPKTVKGTADALRKNIVSGSLGDLSIVLVSKSKAGPFVKVMAAPEFAEACQAVGGFDGSAGDYLAVTDLNRSSDPSMVIQHAHNRVRTRSRIQPVPEMRATPEQVSSGTHPTPVATAASDRTQELAAVPIVQKDNIDAGTDERPKLPTRTNIKPVKTLTPPGAGLSSSGQRMLEAERPNSKVLWYLIGVALLAVLVVIGWVLTHPK